MAKYEIDLIIKGSLKEAEVKSIVKEYESLIKKEKDFNVDNEMGNKLLAYKIHGESNGYYFIYNFESEDPSIINEFRRLADLDTNVLRLLIINLEKIYGYKASINTKKIEKSKKTESIYKTKQEGYKKNKNIEAEAVEEILDLEGGNESEEIENE
ncbi:MAG: 30S ribosomal protein S6 [Mycoplasmataceae bacterium]|jgi:small subunit ribosomal protein S6|nr:30S ribosomal protein S6 [Mycoplasmataceae bacterium]